MSKRAVLQILLLLFVVLFSLSGYLLIRHLLQLPFRATNDTLHETKAPITLDFLIPAQTYLDEKITIGEVIRIRFKRESSTYETFLRTLSDLIPRKYRYIADLVLFLFWSFLFMTFLRVFTFVGYGRAFRVSLVLGGITYYFMPDLSPGRIDDVILVGIPVLIVILRGYAHRRKKGKITMSD